MELTEFKDQNLENDANENTTQTEHFTNFSYFDFFSPKFRKLKVLGTILTWQKRKIRSINYKSNPILGEEEPNEIKIIESDLVYKWSHHLLEKSKDTAQWSVVTNNTQDDLHSNFQVKYALSELLHLISSTPTVMENEESEDLFSEYFSEWFMKHNYFATDVISASFEENLINSKAMSAILKVIGSIDDAETLNARIDVLLDFMNHESVDIRYGALTGISNINEPIFIPSLEKALDTEDILVHKVYIRGIIKQLNNKLKEEE